MSAPLPLPADFPAGTKFVIKEFDVPLVEIPGRGLFNWFGGKPAAYDPRNLRVDNNWPAKSFAEWLEVLKQSLDEASS